MGARFLAEAPLRLGGYGMIIRYAGYSFFALHSPFLSLGLEYQVGLLKRGFNDAECLDQHAYLIPLLAH
jgi:hypothetical protein